MKKSLIIAALIAAAFAVSCNKEAGLDAPEGIQPAESHVFTCVIASDPGTRFGIDAQGKTSWEAGDEIMVHGGKDGADRQLVTLTADMISADGKTATIDIGELGPYNRSDVGVVSEYYAQYPAELVPSGNLYYECRFTATNAPLMAACNVGTEFKFYHLCAIVTFSVAGEFDNFLFSGNNGETVGYDVVYQARVRDDGKGPVVNYNKPGNGSGDPVAKKSVGGPINADGSTVYSIYLPTGASFGGGFTFKFYDGDDLVKIASSVAPVELKPGQLLNLGNITSHLKTYVAPSTSDHRSGISGATDLSSGGAANCYMVTAPGAYKLPVLKGNSDESAGEVFGAELLWETWNNDQEVEANSVIAEVDFDGPENYIYFRTPATLHPGNAVIAAKNSSDKIIWSWHIWIPETTVESSTFGDIYNHALMDRNLGALVAATTSSVPVESFGLHYEWGRKDPFVGAKSVTSSSFASVSGTAMSVAYEMTLAQTIANPTTYAVYTEADSWGNWLSPSNDNTLWQDDVKTIYDPCPPGYRVPKRDKSQPLHSSDLSAVTGWSEGAANGDNAPYFTLGNPATVFPYAGLICENGKYIDHIGKRLFIWTAYCSSSPYIMDVRLGDAHKLNSTVTSRGCSVRCVVDE